MIIVQFRMTETKIDGGVACYIGNDLCFNTKNIFSNYIGHVFLIPKIKPIAIRILYRLPNANELLDIFSNDLQQIDGKIIEMYFLRDVNINLPQNRKIFLKENKSYELKNSISALVNKYKDFREKFSFTAIIKEHTRITCSTSSRF